MEKVAGTKTSVYTGCFTNDWQHLQFKDTERCGTTLALGAQPCVNANRISWFFNFTGNSCNVDTACSSSLVCLDMGCTGLLTRDTEMVCYSLFCCVSICLLPRFWEFLAHKPRPLFDIVYPTFFPYSSTSLSSICPPTPP